MKVLIVKTSSMGDVIHTLPALTDAGRAFPNIRFDWLVEENFATIPTWHPLVEEVIPVAVRRWRKKLFSAATRAEIRALHTKLRDKKYDFIIDAQGLLKSAWLTRLAVGERSGFDWFSAREPLAAFFYQRKFSVAKGQHAIERVRNLFSQALGYALPTSIPDYGVNRENFVDAVLRQENYLIFLHGTTWPTKHWPETYWQQLAVIANKNNFKVKLLWGNAEEEARAKRIAASCSNAEVLPRLGLQGIVNVLASAKAIVAVDTGLGHLAAALNVPTVSLYGPTNPVLTGALGQSQIHKASQFPCAPCLGRECTYRGKLTPVSDLYPLEPVKPPCFTELSPDVVWAALGTLL